MASSARLLGRVRAALGRGDPAPLGTKGMQEIIKQLGGSENALRELPPPGYVLTSSGLLVPHTPNGLTKVDRCLDRVEDRLVERMERGFGLFFRITSVAVGTSACAFLLRLSWNEHTNSGVLQKCIPSNISSTEDHGQVVRTVEQAKAFTSQQVKVIVKEVTELQALQFNSGLAAAIQAPYHLMDYVDSNLDDYRRILEAKGLNSVELAAAQIIFLDTIMSAAKSRLSQTHKMDADLPEKKNAQKVVGQQPSLPETK